MSRLRAYSETHIGESLPDLTGRRFYGALLADCKLGRVAGAVFKDCVLAGSELQASDVRDFLGVTLTLDCFTFEGLRLSPEALDGILFLLTMTQGNDATREKIAAAIDPERLKLYRRLFPQTE